MYIYVFFPDVGPEPKKVLLDPKMGAALKYNGFWGSYSHLPKNYRGTRWGEGGPGINPLGGQKSHFCIRNLAPPPIPTSDPPPHVEFGIGNSRGGGEAEFAIVVSG